MKKITGFSKLNKNQKIDWIIEAYFNNNQEIKSQIQNYWNTDEAIQKLHDEFIENTITNFYLPLGIAPNFLINNEVLAIPMAIEESSVVAAAANAAKYWGERGGFKASVISMEKIGQVHFMFQGKEVELNQWFQENKQKFFTATEALTQNMRKRGGGILDIELKNKTSEINNYYQLHATFNTKDSMGANFINSCLETFAETLENELPEVEVVMSILSNFVPNCIVRAEVSCKVEELADKNIKDPQQFAEKFVQALRIAEVEPYRAVTHNKGVMNGVDAVVIATGNDFRAIEAGVHAYASKDGKYSSLSHAEIKDGNFRFWIDLPLALGTVGGLTNLHPIVKFSMELLGKPSAEKLMEIIAVAGLAQNFAAVKSLTTTGIQKGHMRMHLMNILNQMQATDIEKQQAVEHFNKETVSHSAVVQFIENLRK